MCRRNKEKMGKMVQQLGVKYREEDHKGDGVIA